MRAIYGWYVDHGEWYYIDTVGDDSPLVREEMQRKVPSNKITRDMLKDL
jgi:hypothetical protein